MRSLLAPLNFPRAADGATNGAADFPGATNVGATKSLTRAVQKKCFAE